MSPARRGLNEQFQRRLASIPSTENVRHAGNVSLCFFVKRVAQHIFHNAMLVQQLDRDPSLVVVDLGEPPEKPPPSSSLMPSWMTSMMLSFSCMFARSFNALIRLSPPPMGRACALKTRVSAVLQHAWIVSITFEVTRTFQGDRTRAKKLLEYQIQSLKEKEDAMAKELDLLNSQ